jgi:hypothetical protein
MKTKSARRRLADERTGGATDQHGDRLEGFSDATGEALDVLVLERHDGLRGHANCGREIVLTDEELRIIEYPLDGY